MEIYLATPLIPLGIYLGATAAERALMAGSVLLVPTLELLNGGLEAIVDKTTPELHVLAGRAKDMGSAAVFFAMLNATMVWSLILWPRWSEAKVDQSGAPRLRVNGLQGAIHGCEEPRTGSGHESV